MTFDAYYFAHSCGRPYQRDEEWLAFFDSIAARIVADLAPATVLDAGCAMGFLVETLRARDVEAWGVDISDYAIDNVAPDVQPYCWVGSAADPLPRRYDLIVCIEVLEHMAGDQAEAAIENFCRHSDQVLFSSTPFDYKEATHFHVLPPEAWAESFARHGFFRDVDFDGSFITPWAALFRSIHMPPPRLARAYERRFWQLWKENVDLRELAGELRDQLAAGEAERRELEGQLTEKERRVDELEHQAEEIFTSRSWRLLNVVQRLRLKLIPRGGRLERLLLRRR
jgi:hypothetical protein